MPLLYTKALTKIRQVTDSNLNKDVKSLRSLSGESDLKFRSNFKLKKPDEIAAFTDWLAKAVCEESKFQEQAFKKANFDTYLSQKPAEREVFRTKVLETAVNVNKKIKEAIEEEGGTTTAGSGIDVTSLLTKLPAMKKLWKKDFDSKSKDLPVMIATLKEDEETEDLAKIKVVATAYLKHGTALTNACSEVINSEASDTSIDKLKIATASLLNLIENDTQVASLMEKHDDGDYFDDAKAVLEGLGKLIG